MQLEDLYSEIILDHTRDPRNRRPGDGRGIQVHHHNDLCGDDIVLDVLLDGDRVADVSFTGQGCSISQASASLMTEAVKGLTKTRALEMTETVRGMMHGEPPPRSLGDIRALEGVKKFPVRVKCALLAWMALKDALAQGDQ